MKEGKEKGLLEKTLVEFNGKGNASLEEIRNYLIKKYKVTVSKAVLRKRLDSLTY